MIKIIAQETKEMRNDKLSCDMQVSARGDSDIISQQIAEALFVFWGNNPAIITDALNRLNILIEGE